MEGELALWLLVARERQQCTDACSLSIQEVVDLTRSQLVEFNLISPLRSVKSRQRSNGAGAHNCNPII